MSQQFPANVVQVFQLVDDNGRYLLGTFERNVAERLQQSFAAKQPSTIRERWAVLLPESFLPKTESE